MYICCVHKMGWERIQSTILWETSLYTVGSIYVEAAVIIAIILIEFRKSERSAGVPVLRAAARVLRTMQPCQERRGGETSLMFTLARHASFLLFMPRSCLSSIVRTQCCYSLYPRPSKCRGRIGLKLLSGPSEPGHLRWKNTEVQTWHAGVACPTQYVQQKKTMVSALGLGTKTTAWRISFMPHHNAEAGCWGQTSPKRGKKKKRLNMSFS